MSQNVPTKKHTRAYAYQDATAEEANGVEIMARDTIRKSHCGTLRFLTPGFVRQGHKPKRTYLEAHARVRIPRRDGGGDLKDIFVTAMCAMHGRCGPMAHMCVHVCTPRRASTYAHQDATAEEANGVEIMAGDTIRKSH